VSDGAERVMEAAGYATQTLILIAAVIIAIPFMLLGLAGFHLGLWK
jgi:hypothetical protein